MQNEADLANMRSAGAKSAKKSNMKKTTTLKINESEVAIENKYSKTAEPGPRRSSRSAQKRSAASAKLMSAPKRAGTSVTPKAAARKPASALKKRDVKSQMKSAGGPPSAKMF
jgi:hypothetical protein